MKLVDLERLYLIFPVWIQNIIVGIEGWRKHRIKFGKGYEKIYNDVMKRYNFDRYQLLKYQETRLRRFLTIASTSKYWINKFTEYDVDINAIDIWNEIKKLPIMTKQDAKKHNLAIHTKLNLRKNCLRVSTSGTTGGGLSFWRTVDGYREQWATWWRYWGWHGINQNDLCGNFHGRAVLHSIGRNSPPFWRMDRAGKQLLFSVHHIKAENVRYYVGALEKYNVKWLTGPPSIISLLASYILDQNLGSISSIKLIATGAENLYPHQLDIIKKAFRAPVCQHYGLGESVANFSQCEAGNLHVDEDFSYVEFIPFEEGNGNYKVVGTGWVNPAFPLIRYDTGDIVSEPIKKCSCGRKGRIINQIDGRAQDFIILRDGRRITRLNFLFKDLTNIREAQLYQNLPGSLVIRVVKGEMYDKFKEESSLRKNAKLRLGEDMDIKIEYVDKISKSKMGKLQFVVSEIKNIDS